MVGFSRLGGPDLGRFDGGSRGFVMIPQICDCSLLCFSSETQGGEVTRRGLFLVRGGLLHNITSFFHLCFLRFAPTWNMRRGLVGYFSNSGISREVLHPVQSRQVTLSWLAQYVNASCYDLGGFTSSGDEKHNNRVKL